MLHCRGERAKLRSQFPLAEDCGRFFDFVEMVGFEERKQSFTFVGAIWECRFGYFSDLAAVNLLSASLK